MFVSEIYTEAKRALGNCDQETVFKRLTDAVRLANNKAKYDANIGFMDICVCDGCVTLPSDVATVLAVNNGGSPTLMRDQWFQFHVNGPGNQTYTPWGYTDEVGQFSTFRDPDRPANLIAEVENAQDSNKELRIYGWDVNGNRIYTPGANGALEDGFLVPTVYGFSQPNPLAPAIARIDKVKKQETNGFIRLLATNPEDDSVMTLIGHYQPWETKPLYRRIRVPNLSWIRIKYRKKDLDVKGLADWINIENRLAVLLYLKAVKCKLDGNFDQSIAAENEATRLMSEEAEANRPSGISPPQILFNQFPVTEMDRLFY